MPLNPMVRYSVRDEYFYYLSGRLNLFNCTLRVCAKLGLLMYHGKKFCGQNFPVAKYLCISPFCRAGDLAR